LILQLSVSHILIDSLKSENTMLFDTVDALENKLKELVIVVFSYTPFTLCLFGTKSGSIFFFGPGMYFQTGQVFFVPEWPKGEFVSILCWLHSR
jgi:hypothetical protein